MRALRFSKMVVIGLGVGLATASLGADRGQAKPPMTTQASTASKVAMTPELKKDMAEMYQKMADCLRTEKSLEQCSHDAMKNCPVVEKTGHCPINEGIMSKRMGMGDMDMGMKRNHSMDGGM